jgi:hypothetical protein
VADELCTVSPQESKQRTALVLSVGFVGVIAFSMLGHGWRYCNVGMIWVLVAQEGDAVRTRTVNDNAQVYGVRPDADPKWALACIRVVLMWSSVYVFRGVVACMTDVRSTSTRSILLNLHGCQCHLATAHAVRSQCKPLSPSKSIDVLHSVTTLPLSLFIIMSYEQRVFGAGMQGHTCTICNNFPVPGLLTWVHMST